jgi:hypothetical protein
LNQLRAEDFLSQGDRREIPSGESMRSANVLPASLLAAALAAAFGPPARADILVNIDKNTQSMTVSVDGTPRYIWPVSTGRAGYDTPNGAFKPNRMDADHLSQEWDNAPMPHSIFFDLRGHAIHGFLDTSRIGSAASHGCVRLSPDHAATLYELVNTEGLKETTVVISVRTPVGWSPEVARRRAPVEDVAGQPIQIAPGYSEQQPASGYGQQPPAPYDAQAYYRQAQPVYRQAQPAYGQQPYNGQPLYGQSGYQQPQYYVVQPSNRY